MNLSKLAIRLDKSANERLMQIRINELNNYVSHVNKDLHNLIDTLKKVQFENADLKKEIAEKELLISGLSKDIEILDKTNRQQQTTIDRLFSLIPEDKNVYQNY